MPSPSRIRRERTCDNCGWRTTYTPQDNPWREEIEGCGHDAGPRHVAPDGPPWPVCVWWKPRPAPPKDSYRSLDLPTKEE